MSLTVVIKMPHFQGGGVECGSWETRMEKIDSQYSPSLLSHPDSERVELKRKLLITSAGLEFENSIFVFTVF